MILAKEVKKEIREERPVAKTAGYPVASLLVSEKYANRKDILKVLLDPEKEYSLQEVDNIIDKFMKGKVK